MIEYPVFVPSNGRQIAAIVTLPDGAAEGVVLFTTGGAGALRSQRFRLWTRAARRLAELGIASVRMEYAGMGDSTGTPGMGMGWRGIPVADVRRMAEFAQQATGTSRLGFCGNCAGARASLLAAPDLPSTEALVLFWLKPLAHSAKRSSIVGRVGESLQRLPAPIRRVPARIYFLTQQRSRRRDGVAAALKSASRSADVLLVETASRLAGDLPKVVQRLSESGDAPSIELRGIRSTSMQAFQSLADQAEVVDMIVGRFTVVFGSPARLTEVRG